VGKRGGRGRGRINEEIQREKVYGETKDRLREVDCSRRGNGSSSGEEIELRKAIKLM